MGEISSDLVKFKTSMDGASGMGNSCTELATEVNKVSTSNTSFQSSIDSYYKSNNKSRVIKKVNRISEICTKLAACFESDLKGLVNEAEGLANDVKELEDINKEIEKLKTSLSGIGSETEEDIAKRNNINKQISDNEKKFEEKHEAAKSKLEALRGKDASIAFTEEFSKSNTEANLADLEYGSFELKNFKASSGNVVEYWLYVPDYGKEVENLPVMLYMHGGGNNSYTPDQIAQYGLTSHIKNQLITPSGIVIMPVVHKFNDKTTQDDLIELTNEVVEEYKADENRISVSGHSFGGIMSFNLVNNNPGYFSCCVAISGVNKVTDAFKSTKLWSFNGTYENKGQGPTSYSAGQYAVKAVNSIGGEAFITPIVTGHVGTNKMTYLQEWDSPDGEKENPIEWAFRQERA